MLAPSENEMRKRKLGKSGIEVAPLALGGNVFGWTADESTSLSLLDAFVGAGFNLIDTADAYSNWVPGNKGGESEMIIGNWVKARGQRNRIVIATKVGWDRGPAGRGLSKAYILRSVEGSLKRLQTDYIDLYQSHVDDRDTPLEETLEAHSRLIEQGKVRAIGASNIEGARLAEALAVSRRGGWPRYESLQPRYNLYDREPFESDLAPLCLSEGIGVIPYYSLAAGFLTGKYRGDTDLDGKARGGTVAKYLNDRGRRILNALDRVSAALNATPAQVALAWLMARPIVTAAIASATSLAQLAELAHGAELTLDASAIGTLDQASARPPGMGPQ
jgi:aryl-alcohol dehydrogenase-like predicted oxidoreductase